MKSMFKGAFGALMLALALCGLTAASALAAGAPTVETKPAVGITETTAVANGTINPNGTETKVYAEYGPTTSYGTKTKEHNAGSGTTTVGESWNLIGLTPRTTYHFRVVATNSKNETSYGADLQFFTGRYPAGLPEAVVTSGKINELKIAANGTNGGIAWGNGSSDCESEYFTGHFIDAKEVEGSMQWSGCHAENFVCFNNGEAISSEPLIGELAYTSASKKEVGLLLEGKSSSIWANNLHCSGHPTEIKGKLAGKLVLQVNKKIAPGGYVGLSYETTERAQQLAGELSGQLTWGEGENFGLIATLNGSANKEFEIKA